VGKVFRETPRERLMLLTGGRSNLQQFPFDSHNTLLGLFVANEQGWVLRDLKHPQHAKRPIQMGRDHSGLSFSKAVRRFSTFEKRRLAAALEGELFEKRRDGA